MAEKYADIAPTQRKMTNCIRSDFAVLGGGIAAFELANALSENGAHVCIVCEDPVGSVGGTSGGQAIGWQGSYYALLQPDVASACREGFEQLLHRHPKSVSSSCESFCLFPDLVDAVEFRTACANLGITAELENIEDVARVEPVLSGARFKHAVRTDDKIFNPDLVLKDATARAELAGVSFVPVESVLNVGIERQGAAWIVSGTEAYVEANVLILACGAATIDVLRQLAPGSERLFEATVITGMVLQEPVIRSLLLGSPLIDGVPNIAPFVSDEGNLSGVSVFLNRFDDKIESVELLNDQLDVEGFYVNALEQYYPRLIDIAARRIPGHFYKCFKIQAVGRQSQRRRIIEVLGDVPNLLVFYPGKYTAVIPAAAEAAKVAFNLFDSRGMAHHACQSSMRPAPAIARHAFWRPAEFDLCVRGGHLEVDYR
jgi:hypothetical protein